MIGFTRRSLLAAGAFVAFAATVGCSGNDGTPVQDNAADLATVDDSGRTYALITQPVGKAAPANYAAQLAAAQNRGEISNVVLMKSKPSVEGPLGFDTLAVVEFPDHAAYDKWLSSAAPELGSNLIVRRADLLVDDRAETHGKMPAYVVNHYEALISPDEYADYTNAYIRPNMEGQKAGGVMMGYAMYYERDPVPGIRGNRTVLVKEYIDEAAFSRSEAIKEKDKAKLLKNPEWKRLNDTKDRLRKDIAATLALPVALK